MRASDIQTLIAFLATSFALVGCPSNETEEKVVPLIPPPSSAQVVGAPAVTAPAGAVTGAPPALPAAPAPVTPTTPSRVDAGAPATGGLDAGASADAGKTDAGSAGAADAGTFSDKLTACAGKCQGMLQSCLTPTFPDAGGLPQIKDPKACQTAFDACRAGCTP